MSETGKSTFLPLQGEDRLYLIYDLTSTYKKKRLLYDFYNWLKQDKAHRKRIEHDEWNKIKKFLDQSGTHYIKQNKYNSELLYLYCESDDSEYANSLGPYRIDDDSFGTYLHEISLSKEQSNMANDEKIHLSSWDPGYDPWSYTNSAGSTCSNIMTTAIPTIADCWQDIAITADKATGIVFNNNEKEINKIKGENKMDASKIFGKFDFGKVTNDKVRMSPYGLAVKNTDGTWVSYDIESDSIMNVDVFNFDGTNFLFKIPVALDQVAAGDMIIHNRTPKFVKHINSDNTLYVVDICSGEVTTVIPTKSPFGFNFVTKVINVLGDFKATTDSPFGNMLPWMLMSDNMSFKDMLPLMLMSGGKLDMNNPLMMYAFMCDGNSADNFLPFLLMNSIGNTTAFGGKINA